MRKKKYTVTDLSEMLGVSRATISRAITGAPGVGPELREKVLSLAQEVGYRGPSSIPEVPGTNHQNIIALVLGDIRNPFYADLAFEIQKLLNEAHYLVMVFNSEYETVRELEFIRLAEQFHFAGLILITAQSDKLSQKIKQLPIPKVLVNRVLPDYDGDSVLTDNFQAGYEAALHLIELGHREIGFICGQSNSSSAQQRYEGYCQALRNYSLPFIEHNIYHSDLKLETGRRVSSEFLAGKHHPTAMIAVNDMTALGFMDGCLEAGLHLPDDLSLVSFDNIGFSALYSVRLTTVNQHAAKMSCEAVRLILKQLQQPDAKPERVILKPELIIRHSTGPCPS